MAAVCHGPLGRGRGGAVYPHLGRPWLKGIEVIFLVCCHYASVRVLELSFCPPPPFTGPLPVEGINGLLKDYHRESNPQLDWLNFTAAALSSFSSDAISLCENKNTLYIISACLLMKYQRRSRRPCTATMWWKVNWFPAEFSRFNQMQCSPPVLREMMKASRSCC